jgi:hypothetical protein
MACAEGSRDMALSLRELRAKLCKVSWHPLLRLVCERERERENPRVSGERAGCIEAMRQSGSTNPARVHSRGDTRARPPAPPQLAYSMCAGRGDGAVRTGGVCASCERHRRRRTPRRPPTRLPRPPRPRSEHVGSTRCVCSPCNGMNLNRAATKRKRKRSGGGGGERRTRCELMVLTVPRAHASVQPRAAGCGPTATPRGAAETQLSIHVERRTAVSTTLRGHPLRPCNGGRLARWRPR